MHEIQSATVWWMLAGTLVCCELITGTLYLLMLALGAAAGAIASYAGASEPWQIGVAAIAAAGAVLARHSKRNQAVDSAASAIHATGLDTGATVHVKHWDETTGTGRTQYRGAPWVVQLKDAETKPAPVAGNFKIFAIEGNTLIVE